MFTVDGTVEYDIPVLGSRLAEKQQSTSIEPEPSNIFGQWVTLASTPALPKRPWVQALQDSISMTGLSNRKLAWILGTTHPTVASLKKGILAERVPGITRKAVDLYDTLLKIFRICGSDKRRLQEVLQSPVGSGETVMELLRSEDYSKAYLAAMDYNRGESTTGTLLGVNSVRVPGASTVPLYNDESDDEE